MMKNLVEFLLLTIFLAYSEVTTADDTNQLYGILDCYRFKRECRVAVPNSFEPYECKQKRKKDVAIKRQYYKLTEVGKKQTIEFPLPLPWLNQTMKNVKFRTSLDPIDSRWLSLVSAFKKAVAEMLNNPLLPSLDNLIHYQMVSMKVHQGIKKMKAPQYFSNPAMESTFTNIFQNNRWQSDEFFAQQRLAGACPFLIQRVAIGESVGVGFDELMKLLNPSFNFDGAIAHALNRGGVSLKSAATQGWLYVLYHKETNGMTNIRDFAGGNNINMTSPVTLFVRTSTGDLKVVAIQQDYKSSSSVYSPLSDPIEWSLAKAMVNLVDAHYCQAIWHLSHVHFSSQVYCAVFRSHFSELHPLYQIMQYHCEGTIPHVALSWSTLAMAGQEGHRLSAVGHHGFVKLALIGRKSYRYGTLAYGEILKSRGLDVEKDQLNYFPFRDDGALLWNEFKEFAERFVAIFYKTDMMVQQDLELQSYANEISIDGKMKPFGGRGKVVGFPAQFRTQKELELFITRFLWHIAMHAAVNYPLEPWGTFVPTMPFKLHNDTRTQQQQNLAYALPDKPNTMGMIKFGTLLGNLRVNRIMDHHDKITDDRLKMLVGYSHHRFHACIQKRLEARNAERKSRDLMGFQYFEPKWLTNSVHI